MQIHVQRGAEELGVFTPEETTKYLAEGRLLESDLAWHDGLNDWTPLGGLIRQFGETKPSSGSGEPISKETSEEPAVFGQGRYKRLKVLGKGGQGEVWRAHELKTETGGNTMTDKMTPTDDPSEDILKEYGDADGELSDQDNVALIGEAYAKMREQISKMIIGQDEVVENLLTCIFAGGHCLLVGVPGLAKTLLVTTLSEVLDLDFKRIQFTPDLMPSDITGTDIIQDDPVTRERVYKFMPGPIFANIILADEINRTPPKTQAALLEAMQEKQVSIGSEVYQLERPFFVIATQNPIDQEGTYPLPEAQQDRFLFNIYVDYPEFEEEMDIVQTVTSGAQETVDVVVTAEEILYFRDLIRRTPVADHVLRYAVTLVRATRNEKPESPDFVKDWVSFGAGPRAGLALISAAKARAILQGNFHASVEDVMAVAKPVLRHRIAPNFAAQAEGVTSDTIIEKLLETIPRFE